MEKQTDHEKLKEMMSDVGLDYRGIAAITGHSYHSIKTMLQPNKKLPRWMRLVMHVWEKKSNVPEKLS